MEKKQEVERSIKLLREVLKNNGSNHICMGGWLEHCCPDIDDALDFIEERCYELVLANKS